MNLIEKQVSFKIRDVQFPERTELLLDLFGDETLIGKVVDVTDNACNGQLFAVVQVAGLDDLSIVALDALQPVS